MVEALRNVCLKFNLLAVRPRGEERSGARQEMADFSLEHSTGALMLKHWYTKRWKQGERWSSGEQKEREGGGARREVQYAPVPPVVQLLLSHPSCEEEWCAGATVRGLDASWKYEEIKIENLLMYVEYKATESKI